jgi:hypothetical protein
MKALTAQEVIEELQKLPPETIVVGAIDGRELAFIVLAVSINEILSPSGIPHELEWSADDCLMSEVEWEEAKGLWPRCVNLVMTDFVPVRESH